MRETSLEKPFIGISVVTYSTMSQDDITRTYCLFQPKTHDSSGDVYHVPMIENQDYPWLTGIKGLAAVVARQYGTSYLEHTTFEPPQPQIVSYPGKYNVLYMSDINSRAYSEFIFQTPGKEYLCFLPVWETNLICSTSYEKISCKDKTTLALAIAVLTRVDLNINKETPLGFAELL